ncbi:hypothetical protein BaRGS_00012085, partial [Batillaria attramentaria]
PASSYLNVGRAGVIASALGKAVKESAIYVRIGSGCYIGLTKCPETMRMLKGLSQVRVPVTSVAVGDGAARPCVSSVAGDKGRVSCHPTPPQPHPSPPSPGPSHPSRLSSTLDTTPHPRDNHMHIRFTQRKTGGGGRRFGLRTILLGRSVAPSLLLSVAVGGFSTAAGLAYRCFRCWDFPPSHWLINSLVDIPLEPRGCRVVVPGSPSKHVASTGLYLLLRLPLLAPANSAAVRT